LALLEETLAYMDEFCQKATQYIRHEE